MFKKIEHRLVIIILLVVVTFSVSFFIYKTSEKELIAKFAIENSELFKKNIINCIKSELAHASINVDKTIKPECQTNANDVFITIPDEFFTENEKYLIAKISSAIGAEIAVISENSKSAITEQFSTLPYINYCFIYLRGQSGIKAKILLAKSESEALKRKVSSFTNDYIGFTVILTLLVLTITALLYLQVSKPFSKIIRSFKSNKSDELSNLINDKSEFGLFAKLVKEFIDQKKILEEEVRVRKITQEELETLNDELEKRVSDRTEELAVTNLELQNERDQTKLYLDIAGTIIAVLDKDGYIQLINKKGDEVLGYESGELIGKNWYDTCVQKKQRDDFKKNHNDIISGSRIPSEFVISEVITKSQEVRTLIFHITFIKNNEGKYNSVLFSAEDITDLKQKERELIEAKEKADESNKLKSTFLANMSHELRTPMIGILGYSDLLINELKNDNHKKMVLAIHDSGQRLIDTLNLILDLSRLEANKHNIDYQVVNLNSLVKSATFHFEAAAGRKKLFLKTSLPTYDVVSRTDPRMIRDVINNLINNAIKFTKEGGVFVKLEMLHRDFIISIKDTGIGIPEESLGLVFEEFRQVSEGLGRGFQGTGLGLTICKKYVELLGGQISVKSTPNEGSEFTFQIPLFTEEISPEFDSLISGQKAISQIDIDTLKIEKKPDEKKNILIVEDDPTSRDVINLFLNKIYNVHFAETGEQALQLVIKKQFDLILMDINLGTGISGVEVLEKIRQIKNYEKIPVIAATAFAMLGDRERFITKGFDHYISKPYLKQQLIKLVSEVLENNDKSNCYNSK